VHHTYTTTNIAREIKSRKVRWAGHVAHTVERSNAYRVLVGKPEGKSNLEDIDLNGSIILNVIFKK